MVRVMVERRRPPWRAEENRFSLPVYKGWGEWDKNCRHPLQAEFRAGRAMGKHTGVLRSYHRVLLPFSERCAPLHRVANEEMSFVYLIEASEDMFSLNVAWHHHCLLKHGGCHLHKHDQERESLNVAVNCTEDRWSNFKRHPMFTLAGLQWRIEYWQQETTKWKASMTNAFPLHGSFVQGSSRLGVACCTLETLNHETIGAHDMVIRITVGAADPLSHAVYVITCLIANTLQRSSIDKTLRMPLISSSKGLGACSIDRDEHPLTCTILTTGFGVPSR